MVLISGSFAKDGFYPEMIEAQAQVSSKMAEAMKHGVIAGRLAYLGGRMPKRLYASASWAMT